MTIATCFTHNISHIVWYLFLHWPSIWVLYTVKITTTPTESTKQYSLPRVVLSLGSDLSIWKLGPDLTVLNLVLGLLVETESGLLLLEDKVDV